MAVAPPWGIVLLRPGPPGPMPTFYTHLLGPLHPPGPPPGRRGPKGGRDRRQARHTFPHGSSGRLVLRTGRASSPASHPAPSEDPGTTLSLPNCRPDEACTDAR